MNLRLASALAGGLLCLAPSGAWAQSRFATSIVALTPGPGDGIFVPNNVLDGPFGGGLTTGSFDVLSLGEGGELTVGFDVTITDGPGADLIVFENAFYSALDMGIFAETAHVEVSTNGTDFARFPVRYSGPPGPLAQFGAVPWGSFTHMAGTMPVLANIFLNPLDPFNPVEAGGDAFDLAELSDHPLVQSGLVDLSAIHFVRVVDYISGTEVDVAGTTIWDVGTPSGADIDAFAVIQHTDNQDSSGPTVDLWRDANDYVNLLIEDPDGFSDLDPAQLRTSVNLVEVPFHRLRDYFVLVSPTPGGVHLRTPAPVTSLGLSAVLAVSAVDSSGSFAADQISLNP